jgi:hypothetical protein
MVVDSDDEQSRIKDNLAVVRCYLKNHFPLYTITETSVPNLYHEFVVTNNTLHKRHRLKVEWARLSDRSNTPENTRSALDSGNVASGMIQVGDSDYYW